MTITIKEKSNLMAFLTLLFIGFWGDVAMASKLPKAEKDHINYLFVQSAGKVRIEADEKCPGTYKVILKNVHPYVTYFSDRPYRKTNSMPVQQFVALWNRKGPDNFTDNPPNADLVAARVGFFERHELHNFVVELKAPQYDAKSKTLTYVVSPLNGSELPRARSMTLHHVFLFIDDVCLACWDN